MIIAVLIPKFILLELRRNNDTYSTLKNEFIQFVWTKIDQYAISELFIIPFIYRAILRFKSLKI